MSFPFFGRWQLHIIFVQVAQIGVVVIRDEYFYALKLSLSCRNKYLARENLAVIVFPAGRDTLRSVSSVGCYKPIEPPHPFAVRDNAKDLT